MELVFITNGLKSARSVVSGGREWLVAPATILVPGVLAGNKGPLYYPPEEVRHNPSEWDGIPLTVGHPLVNGVHVSAKTAGVTHIGRMRKTTYDGALKTEAWFDVQATLSSPDGPEIVAALRSGRPIGLSTGLFTDQYPAPDGATFNGRPYVAVARNYRPDHLAILYRQRGACSINDGCGIHINSADDPLESVTVDTPEPADFPELSSDEFWAEFNGLVETLNKAGFPSAGLKMTPEKACKIMKDGMVHGHPLSEKQKGMFGALCGQRAEKKSATANSVPSPVPLENNMASLNHDQRKKIIHDLTTNCECGGAKSTPWEGKTAAELDALTDETLNTYEACRRALAANTGPRDGGYGSFTDGMGNRHDYDQTTKMWKTTPGKAPANPPIVPVTPAVNAAADVTPLKRPASLMEALTQFGTPEEKAVWNSAVEVHNRRKSTAIETLTAHLDGQAKEAAVAIYNEVTDVAKLEMMAEHAARVSAVANANAATPMSVPNWFGSQGARPTTNYDAVTEPPLAMPTFDAK